MAILSKGTIVAEGTPNDIITSANRDIRILVKTRDNSLIKLNLPQIIQSKQKNEYVVFKCEDIEEGLSEILTYIKASNDKILDLNVERTSLEERFMDITKIEVSL